jgi:hypothetical protein
MTLSGRRFHLADKEELVAFETLHGNLAIEWSVLTDKPAAIVMTPSEEYGAALCARDLATMAHLGPLSTVVIVGTLEAARMIDALLSGEVVTMSNSAGTLTSAYNRPPPPQPLAIFVSVDGNNVSRVSAE